MNLRTILAVLSVAASAGLAAPPAARADGRDWTGYQAPEITAADGVNGVQAGMSMASLRGRVVLVKFFFPGCEACQQSLPGFQRLHEVYSSKGALVMGVAGHGDSVYGVKSFLDSRGFTFPVAVDPSGASARRYQLENWPTNYVIGADGVVKAYVHWDEEFPTWLIDRELAAGARQRNLDELGSVPLALDAVKSAAAQNDYGEVLRIVEPHLAAATDSPEVRDAAKRIQGIAHQRYERRSDRIRTMWGKANYLVAYRAVQALATDFRGTSKQGAAQAWAKAFKDTPQIQALRLKD